MRHLVAGAALALALAGAAQAADRPVQIGDVYRYSSEFEEAVTGGDQPFEQSNRFVYDLEVVDARADGFTIRFTVRDVQVTDSRGPVIEELGQAFMGLSVEFETGPGFEPTRLLDWPQVRQAFLDHLRPELRPGVSDSLDDIARDPQALAEQFSGDLKLFSAFQDPQKASDGCRVTSSRSDVGMINGARYKSRSNAVVSGYDGWVLEAGETRTDEKAGGVIDSKTTKVRRLSPQPTC